MITDSYLTMSRRNIFSGLSGDAIRKSVKDRLERARNGPRPAYLHTELTLAINDDLSCVISQSQGGFSLASFRDGSGKRLPMVPEGLLFRNTFKKTELKGYPRSPDEIPLALTTQQYELIYRGEVLYTLNPTWEVRKKDRPTPYTRSSKDMKQGSLKSESSQSSARQSVSRQSVTKSSIAKR